MDLSAFKQSLTEVLKELPPELRADFATVFTIIAKRMPVLAVIGPALWPKISNHVMALAMEFSIGVANTEGLDKVLDDAMKEIGVALPEIPRSVA